INAGAFLGMLLCGYIGEKIGWHYGFGLAGVIMFFGMLQFFFAQKIFGIIGEKPDTTHKPEEHVEKLTDEETPKHVVRDRLIVAGVLMLASVFFVFAFEQAGGSMSIFAKDYTQRVLEGSTGLTFKWIDAALTIFPIIIVTWVLYGL